MYLGISGILLGTIHWHSENVCQSARGGRGRGKEEERAGCRKRPAQRLAGEKVFGSWVATFIFGVFSCSCSSLHCQTLTSQWPDLNLQRKMPFLLKGELHVFTNKTSDTLDTNYDCLFFPSFLVIVFINSTNIYWAPDSGEKWPRSLLSGSSHLLHKLLCNYHT